MNGNINFRLLTVPEQLQYKKLITEVIKPEIDRETAVKQAESFKILYALSAERTADGLADLVRSGGDGNAVGRTFKARPRDKVSQMLSGALYYIGDKIPSQATILNQSVGANPANPLPQVGP